MQSLCQWADILNGNGFLDGTERIRVDKISNISLTRFSKGKKESERIEARRRVTLQSSMDG